MGLCFCWSVVLCCVDDGVLYCVGSLLYCVVWFFMCGIVWGSNISSCVDVGVLFCCGGYLYIVV